MSGGGDAAFAPLRAPVRAWVGLGANLGNVKATFAAAFEALSALPNTVVAARSSYWHSAPVDAEGPEFTNAVAALDTELSPHALLAALQAIEAAQGRTRPYRHAPRTLDLDLLLHGETVCESSTLTLPHPRLHLRAFVLEPLWELAPGLVIPGLGPLAAWRAAAGRQAVWREVEV